MRQSLRLLAAAQSKRELDGPSTDGENKPYNDSDKDEKRRKLSDTKVILCDNTIVEHVAELMFLIANRHGIRMEAVYTAMHYYKTASAVTNYEVTDMVIGAICLFIARKYEEEEVAHECNTLQNWLAEFLDTYMSPAQICELERQILYKLDWKLNYPDHPLHSMRAKMRAQSFSELEIATSKATGDTLQDTTICTPAQRDKAMNLLNASLFCHFDVDTIVDKLIAYIMRDTSDEDWIRTLLSMQEKYNVLFY